MISAVFLAAANDGNHKHEIACELRPCLKNAKTTKRWIFSRHSSLNFLAGRQPRPKGTGLGRPNGMILGRPACENLP